MVKTSASVILCVFKKNCIFQKQLCAFFWFQYWKSHCPLCFQVQSVQKYLSECVVPQERQLCMCVLPDFLPHAFILPHSLQLFAGKQKTGSGEGELRLALKGCNFSALELLRVWQIFAGTYPALFPISTHISWAAFKNIPDSSQGQMDGVAD